MSDPHASTPVVPVEGWHVLHLFYKVEHSLWQLLSPDEQRAARTHFTELVEEIRRTPDTQLLFCSVISPKADLGFMLITPDLQTANALEKRLHLALGPDILAPVFSFFSLTESSEYTTSEDEYTRTLEQEQSLAPGSPEFDRARGEFRARMEKYRKDKLYPVLYPNIAHWPVFCFYPMSKRRAPGQNWYALPFDERKRLMAAHGRLGRKWHGKILQLITGATGLDDAEWGVTLFAHNTFHLKEIVYAMRFDEVSAQYADFGEFYVGLQVPLDELFRRLMLAE